MQYFHVLIILTDEFRNLNQQHVEMWTNVCMCVCACVYIALPDTHTHVSKG